MRYIAKRNFDILNTLFLKGETIYIGQSQYIMDGNIDYGRKVYDSNRYYLGIIRDRYFHSNIEHNLEKVYDDKPIDGGEMSKENASFILKAVNNHEKLVDMLDGLVNDVSALLSDNDIEWQQAGCFNEAKQLLTELKQQQ